MQVIHTRNEMKAHIIDPCHSASAYERPSITWIHGPTKQRNTPSTNQEPVRGSKGPHPHGNKLETPHTYPYTHEGPPSSHPDERRCKQNWHGFGRTPSSGEPSVGPFAPIRYVVACDWSLRAFPRCVRCFETQRWVHSTL